MKKTPDKGWQGFLKLCATIKTVEDFDLLFGLFLTIEEREALRARYLIVTALLEGKLTQREIAKTYATSIAQITRGSNALKIIDPRLKKILQKHQK